MALGIGKLEGKRRNGDGRVSAAHKMHTRLYFYLWGYEVTVLYTEIILNQMHFLFF